MGIGNQSEGLQYELQVGEELTSLLMPPKALLSDCVQYAENG
jgi:hypothetical protein